MNALNRLDSAQAELAAAHLAVDAMRARRKIECGCGKRHAIGKLALIVTHWYTGPRGCTGGDYWNEGEWQFVCPTSGQINRIMFDDYDLDWKQHGSTEAAFKRIYRGLFASRVDSYESKTDRRPSFNNRSVDRDRKRFELPLKQAKPK